MNVYLLSSFLSTEAIIAYVFAGILLATTAMFLHKYCIGKFVDKMEKEGIHTPEKAKYLTDLPANFIVRMVLKDGSSVRRLFGYVVGEEIHDNPSDPLPKSGGRLDLSHARFYLLPEKRAEATTRFPAKGNSPLVFIVCVVLLVVGYFLLKDILPVLIEELITSYSGNE